MGVDEPPGCLPAAGRRGEWRLPRDECSPSTSTRYEYGLTDKGRAFWDVLAAMWRWGSDWLWAEGKRPPVMLVDPETGAEIKPVVVDESTGKGSTCATCAWRARAVKDRRMTSVIHKIAAIGGEPHG